MSISFIQAFDALRCSQAIIFPTDTVYALACDAADEHATLSIFSLKRRPKNKSLPLLVSSVEMVEDLAHIPQNAYQWMENYWPGALTIILPLKESSIIEQKIAPSVLAGKASIAVRMPNHPQALSLISDYGKPLAATSANLSGEAACIDAESVSLFQKRIKKEREKNSSHPSIGAVILHDQMLDFQPSTTASTVIDATGSIPVILRSGECTPLV